MNTPPSLDALIDAASVIPVLAVKRLEDAAPLAMALAAGGLKVIELTLRTDVALDAMKAMQDAAPELIVGMGTIRTPEQARASAEAGASFLVSPGLTPELGEAMLATGLACLPGVATAGEAMASQAQGFEVLKFFPAEPAGGIAYLKALEGPLPDIRFCPTGSISREKAPDYLALTNVVCVGGSWIASPGDIDAGNWTAITANARAAEAMKGR
ncbi:bifunctional 4-hydroxy-2-oxoglutarate aldolase/2-dehydro-3-deoxy-phosphogluconate aldolase [Glycocaulis abyssi]|jgi:2-dehydro-3-deoxyphosphogluconate aldolase/(4S)-4-hydroxy-2-oxoglutarate aldolase|uniref:2-dehydro-3-deoxy-phosphogluconate aldolase n=2 Tax=Glycocaulis TaxID=1433402 RepID=A0ABQ1XQL6_9PROT|nr:bifunctional 4-hydroxy-2-oxoglutarate aldolase/2-dehydro-3-deoxy-phosphogluconate aldolase [Glycocaulis albus]MBV5257377.1 bifunctional 4-hydroxy-2-oxoglutarate aldolase/2-dehydro-3-deoxy-phosphogluconate aldolase [Synechococcus moorigangaii CMS01]GGH00551.1 ketohydroxyglutarate aldolase [Glycocaulis albus]